MPDAQKAHDEAMFLKFIGPMRTLHQGKMKFEKDRIYKVLDHERALDMIDTGRFQQTRDPAAPADKGPRRGVRINTRHEDQAPPENRPERGDLSQADLDRGGSIDDRLVAEVSEAKAPGDDHIRLPASQFTSKKDAVEWAELHLGVKLDRNRSITELNNRVVEEYGRKFGARDDAEHLDEDDTREENTTIEAIVVA